MSIFRSNAEESYYIATTGNSTSSVVSEPNRGVFLGIYGSMVLGLLFLCLFCIELFYAMTIVASKTLHSNMLSSLMTASMYFFDNNSIGEFDDFCFFSVNGVYEINNKNYMDIK